MGRFSYIARRKDGQRDSGVLEAGSQDEAILQLQQKGLVVTSVISFDVGRDEMAAQAAASPRRPRSQFTHGGVKANDLVIFARQLALLLGAGVSLLRCLDIILKQVDSRQLFKIITQVRQDMEGGRTLRDSLAKFPNTFSNLWVNLIETGEASGNLPMVLEKLAYYLEESLAFQSKIVSALMYPGILLLISVSAVVFFVVKIVPTFSKILVSFGVEMPLATRIVIGLSDTLTKRWYLIAGGVFAIVFIFKQISRQPRLAKVIENAKFRIPIMGEFYRYVLLERFATTMGILIESGVPILYALEIAERSAGSSKMAEAVGQIKRSVREGRSMAEPMEKNELFTPMLVQLVAIGEEIGELNNMLKRIGKFYQDYLATFVTRLATIFEPLMIVFIGIIIGAMVISIFLPIFNLALSKGG
jgi:type IV pilus assembly protein PilC